MVALQVMQVHQETLVSQVVVAVAAVVVLDPI
jgi:hypothetical protein